MKNAKDAKERHGGGMPSFPVAAFKDNARADEVSRTLDEQGEVVNAIKITLVLACMSATTVLAQEDKRLIRLAPEEIKTPQSATTQAGTSGVGGLQMGVLSGNPRQTGLYTLFLKLGPNTRIQPHSHPDDRVGFVISGTWYFAHGDTFDETKLKRLPPGSFYTEPPGASHFAMTKDESVTIYVTGTGPTGTVYVNPADDPSKK